MLSWTEMCYLVFPKGTHKSRTSNGADTIFLAVVGLPPLIFKKKKKKDWYEQADSKYFLILSNAPENKTPCSQPTFWEVRKKWKRSDLIWFFLPPPSFTVKAICSKHQPHTHSGLSLSQKPHLASLLFPDFSTGIVHWGCDLSSIIMRSSSEPESKGTQTPSVH